MMIENFRITASVILHSAFIIHHSSSAQP